MLFDRFFQERVEISNFMQFALGRFWAPTIPGHAGNIP
jgi:hypothetical protein